MNNNTTGEVTTYAWDCFNRMTAATLPDGSQAGFGYDPDGMLISQTSDGIERRFVQQNRFASREYVKNPQGGWEISASHVVNGTMLASHISSHSIGKTSQNGGRQQNTATHINYHPDHLGSVRLVTDEAGRIIDKPQTDAYGNPIPHKTATSTPGAKSNQNAKILQKFNFTGTHGIKYVEKIRMHNMRARWYGGNRQGFISTDPIKMINRYAYTNNNPTMNIDITGLMAVYLTDKDIAYNRKLNWQLPLKTQDEIQDPQNSWPSGQIDGSGSIVYHWHGYGNVPWEWKINKETWIPTFQHTNDFHYGIDQKVATTSTGKYQSVDVFSPVDGQIFTAYYKPNLYFPDDYIVAQDGTLQSYPNLPYKDYGIVIKTSEKFCWHDNGKQKRDQVYILIQHMESIAVEQLQFVTKGTLLGYSGYYLYRGLSLKHFHLFELLPHIHLEISVTQVGQGKLYTNGADSVNINKIFFQR